MVSLADFVFWCGVSGCMFAGLLVAWCFFGVSGVGLACWLALGWAV